MFTIDQITCKHCKRTPLQTGLFMKNNACIVPCQTSQPRNISNRITISNHIKRNRPPARDTKSKRQAGRDKQKASSLPWGTHAKLMKIKKLSQVFLQAFSGIILLLDKLYHL